MAKIEWVSNQRCVRSKALDGISRRRWVSPKGFKISSRRGVKNEGKGEEKEKRAHGGEERKGNRERRYRRGC